MFCYRDMTFCSFWKFCKQGDTCERALTESVLKNAKEWWGKDEPPPVCLYAKIPDCYKEV